MNLLLILISTFSGWIRTYEKMMGEGNVRVTTDGGYVTTGNGWEDSITNGVRLLKTDSLGNPEVWKLYPSTYYSTGNCVQQTKDGGYIITGVTYEYDGWGDLLLIKTDEKGDTEWTRVYKSDYEDEGFWIELTKDDGYIISGEYSGIYIWLLKLDINGDTMWTREYSQGNMGDCVKPTRDGGYILSTSYGIIKTDSAGDTLWTYKFVCMTSSVCESADGGYVFTATTWGSFGSRDIFLVKLDANGDSVWSRSYGGAGDDYGLYVQQTSDGGYISVGATWSISGGWLLKLDTNGDTTWTRIYSGFNTRCGQQTSDGGYILSGMKYDSTFLIKTDSLGYVGIEEPLTEPAQTDWQAVSPIGSTVILRYSNLPQGFHAFVFDASGRKVDEIQSQGESGTITWGQGKNPGVYFIKTNSLNIPATKVVLLQ